MVGKGKGSIVHKILNFVPEANTTISMMAWYLVIGAIGVWVVVRWEFFGWLTGFKRLDEVFV